MAKDAQGNQNAMLGALAAGAQKAGLAALGQELAAMAAADAAPPKAEVVAAIKKARREVDRQLRALESAAALLD